MAAQLVAMFGVPPPDDRSVLPRLKTVVMEALVKDRAPCTGIHRIEAPRQVEYDALLAAVCMNGASYGVRFGAHGRSHAFAGRVTPPR